MRNFSLLVLGLCLAGNVLAFQGDYIWQEKFNKEMAKATTGNTSSQYKVGAMYEKGQGVNKDPMQAFMWYGKAAEKKHTKALYEVGYFYYNGIATEKDYEKAYEFMSQSAELGYPRAQYYMGEMYESGHGAEKNSETAMSWYSRASLGGYGAAKDALERLKKLEAKAAANAKAQKVAVNKSAPEKVAVVEEKTMADMILSRHYLKGKRPIEYLPSSIAQCEKVSAKVLQCMSQKRSRDVGTVKIDYETKSMIFDIANNGQFKVVYRNNILKVYDQQQDEERVAATEDEEASAQQAAAEEGSQTRLSTGWQETEHQMECKLSGNAIECVKDKTRKVQLSAVDFKGVVAHK